MSQQTPKLILKHRFCNKSSKSCTQSQFTRCSNYRMGGPYILESCRALWVWDARANKSRVHTRIINSGSEGNNSVNITIWRTELGLQWGPRLGFDPRC